MYLFATFNNNTNAMLNKKKDYKELVYTAEVRLNKELDNIKNGNIPKESIKTTDEISNEALWISSLEKERNIFRNSSNKNTEENIVIRKRVDIIDRNRGVYMVIIDASKDKQKISLQGYEQWKEDGSIVVEE